MRLIAAFLLVTLAASTSCQAAGKPVRVFILAGPSNMEGAGQIKADPKRNEGQGSLDFLVKNAAAAKRFPPPGDGLAK